jgi:CMP-N-acetylneuraminic acid synthetase
MFDRIENEQIEDIAETLVDDIFEEYGVILNKKQVEEYLCLGSGGADRLRYSGDLPCSVYDLGMKNANPVRFWGRDVARGSKGIPEKNTIHGPKVALNGKSQTLVEHAVDQALSSNILQSVMLSTNCNATAEHFSGVEGLSVHYRLNEIPQREATMKEVIRDWKAETGAEGHLCLLYMTFVKRTWRQIDEYVHFYLNEPDKPLIGMIADEPMHPYRFLEYLPSSGRVTELFKGQTNISRRQEYPVMYPFTHYACVFDLEGLTEMSANLISMRSRPYWLKKADCVDVDTMEDLRDVPNAVWMGVSSEAQKMLLGHRDV